MSFRKSIPDIVENSKECIMVPCVYDCASARAAELSGYEAILLSGGEVGESLGALSEDELSEPELLFVASHICDFSPLPLIIDCGCFNPEPTSFYRWSRKFALAGAGALLVEDEENLPKKAFLKMVRASIVACEGTRCVVIGRTNRRLKSSEDFEYVIDILNSAVDEGVYMTMACGLNSMEKAVKIGKRVKGLKFYPDQNSHNGKPEIVNSEIYSLGFSMVSFHYSMKVAMAAMIDYGLKDLKSGNNVPSNEVRFLNGKTGASALPMFDYQTKFDFQAKYTGTRKIMHVPGEEND